MPVRRMAGKDDRYRDPTGKEWVYMFVSSYCVVGKGGKETSGHKVNNYLLIPTTSLFYTNKSFELFAVLGAFSIAV